MAISLILGELLTKLQKMKQNKLFVANMKIVNIYSHFQIRSLFSQNLLII